MRDYHIQFEPGHYYHIFNRGNNSDLIFYQKRNYTYFLQRYEDYLSDLLDTYAYCLMPNHFHLLVRVKHEEEILPKSQRLRKYKSVPSLISQQFKNLFISYSKAINKQQNRTGALFQNQFKRVKVDSERYLRQLVIYIHHNPVHHQFIHTYTDWIFSSYTALTSDKSTKLNRNDVLEWFGGIDAFTDYHKKMINYNSIDHLIIE